MKYDYRDEMKKDVRRYVKEEITLSDWDSRGDLEEHLNDVLWTEDSVTGNGSGSYTFSTWQAEENLCHNWDLLAEAICEFGLDKDYLLERGAEAADVLIRCYLLGGVISEVLDELEEVGA